MEQANKRIESYLIQFKQDIQQKIKTTEFQEKEKTCELLEYIWEYPKFQFQQKHDANLFNKKTEKKSTETTANQQVKPEDQCIAKRSADGDQCTRKKKKGSNYCGTHAKIEKNATNQAPPINKMEVSAEDIHGIIYYIDAHNNVYHTEDILESKENPRIIAKAIRHPDNTFTIPELFQS